eukprot:COSAG01_NODE_4475_length_4988_cov_16.399264_3_plen_86_part_00
MQCRWCVVGSGAAAAHPASSYQRESVSGAGAGADAHHLHLAPLLRLKVQRVHIVEPVLAGVPAVNIPRAAARIQRGRTGSARAGG